MELNATYDFLMQVRRKETVIRRKEALRDELVACLGPRGARFDQNGVRHSGGNMMEKVMARVADLDTEIEQLKREKASLAIVISDAIEKLEDENEKTVLTEFYIARAPMTVVANSINYSTRRAYDFRRAGVAKLGEVLG